MVKWIGIGLGTLLGLSHIGMIGMIARKSDFPVVNVPVGPYTSYEVTAGKDGYNIRYRANDPKVMHVERDVKRKGGFLGLGNNTTKIREQYTMEGTLHMDPRGSVSTTNPSGKSVECIEAIGAGKGTGRMVGASVGAAVSPSLASVPFVGWVLAGAATMMGMDQGAEIGGTMVEGLSPECEEDVTK